ncbi:hypothetical protein [Kitasatospora herbaricolor]|uniref:Uncharacterized protein n=1 Tax=Kitasatospora herbaricolor TaxID=68217 RepID=A0ABZ1WI41_9ACTN|nr:hypothetical protein [Kitasatospora herbaricolor]
MAEFESLTSVAHTWRGPEDRPFETSISTVRAVVAVVVSMIVE